MTDKWMFNGFTMVSEVRCCTEIILPQPQQSRHSFLNSKRVGLIISTRYERKKYISNGAKMGWIHGICQKQKTKTKISTFYHQLKRECNITVWPKGKKRATMAFHQFIFTLILHAECTIETLDAWKSIYCV